VKYLLDVNVLVALGFLQHEFHERVANWVHTLASRGIPELATCSITELGFVRVLAQARSMDSPSPTHALYDSALKQQIP
jgi:predicted nucleic acid-binding protein